MLGLATLSSVCVSDLHRAIGLYTIIVLVTSFSLTFSEVSLVGLALDLVDIVLQCHDTVGWVI